jgi:hypothetical protein
MIKKKSKGAAAALGSEDSEIEEAVDSHLAKHRKITFDKKVGSGTSSGVAVNKKSTH